MARALPGIERQLGGVGGLLAIQRGGVDLGTAGDEARGDVPDRVGGALVVTQAGDGLARPVERLQRLGDRTGEDRARRHFEEERGAELGGALHRGGEQHRLADVAPPVAGVAGRAVHDVAGDGGDEGQGAGAGVQLAEIGDHLVFQRVEQVRMEGVVEIHQDHRDAFLPHPLLRRLDVLGRAAQRDRGRAVHRRDGDAAEPVAVEEGLHLGGAGGGDRHAALALDALLVEAAQMDEAHGFLEAERAGRPGRRDFADAVAEHHVRGDALRAQRRHQRRLDGEQQRLRGRGFLQPDGEVVGVETLDDRPARQRREQRVDAVDMGAEDGVARIGATPHAGPLAAIAGEHEGGLAVRLGLAALGRGGLHGGGAGAEGGRAALAGLAQRLHHVTGRA
ncbi:hypothetical protein GCM10028812_04010 [Ancylobacter sonchi]|nr:hypothetical protein [Ancylobacter sonchi]